MVTSTSLEAEQAMSDKEIIRSNAKLILRHVRGKSKDERKIVYDTLRLGPWSLPIAAANMAAKLKAYEASIPDV